MFPRPCRPLAIWLAATIAIVVVGGGPTLLPRLGVCTTGWLPGDDALNTGPYVQDVTATTAIVRWWNERDEAGIFAYGEEGGVRSEVEPSGGALREVRLAGLRPGTRYEYRIQGEADNRAGGFWTDPGPGATVTVGALGDSGTGSGAQFDVGRVLGGMAPDLVLHTGDVIYPDGSLCGYDAGFFEPYADVLPRAPFYPTVGNHDLETGDGAPYDRVFALPAGEPGETNRNFAFTYGPLHVVVVDSEPYETEDAARVAAQRAWLEGELAAGGDTPWTIVVVHHPPYNSTTLKDAPEVHADLTPIFARYGVDLVLSGDVHNYERFMPIDGVTYVVTGGGGADLHRALTPGTQTAAAAAVYHAVKLVVGPETLTLEAIDRDGEVFDRAEFSRR